ncbi:FMN-dependent alpha-hydroxy acid dehydrogenase [Armillaria luteobubalina]|uniref:FMN-dependent alpha-hydroxy acid dehydrogenase n=1 Tax=Armillaria luteobubalina TaxID=153913 RepID=A0AA39QE97_9AGAR|nr:FMN-dependent alpha-hydroxy acid dehydrogenase [Armillaria luteobubalina]
MSFKAALESRQEAPESWSSYMHVVYDSRREPSIGSYDAEKLEAKAREVTMSNHSAFLYVFGSAGSCSTDRANKKAFKKWSFIPKMLVDASDRTLETTLFGVTYKSPLLLAPIGVHGLLNKDGEVTTSRAAAKVGVPFITSTASTRSLEDVAEANGNGQRWYQLYWPRSEEITLSLLGRAKKGGYTACIVTLDTMCMGWRPYDLDKAYLFSSTVLEFKVLRRVLTSEFLSHSTLLSWMRNEHEGDEHEIQMQMLGKNWSRQIHSGLFRTWEELAFVRRHWEGPLILKGILSVGCDGIVVSNHGGRQIDGSIPSLVALEKITADPRIQSAQVEGKFTVLFDSGIRRGSDVIKAIALGAQAVLLGRPYMYGLAISGEQGVEEVVRGILCEAEITLGLCGYSNLSQIWGKKDQIMEKMDIGFYSP